MWIARLNKSPSIGRPKMKLIAFKERFLNLYLHKIRPFSLPDNSTNIVRVENCPSMYFGELEESLSIFQGSRGSHGHPCILVVGLSTGIS